MSTTSWPAPGDFRSPATIPVSGRVAPAGDGHVVVEALLSGAAGGLVVGSAVPRPDGGFAFEAVVPDLSRRARPALFVRVQRDGRMTAISGGVPLRDIAGAELDFGQVTPGAPPVLARKRPIQAATRWAETAAEASREANRGSTVRRPRIKHHVTLPLPRAATNRRQAHRLSHDTGLTDDIVTLLLELEPQVARRLAGSQTARRRAFSDPITLLIEALKTTGRLGSEATIQRLEAIRQGQLGARGAGAIPAGLTIGWRR